MTGDGGRWRSMAVDFHHMHPSGHDGAMKIVLVIIGIVALDLVAIAVIMRFLKHPADRWHVDPMTAPTPATPNSYRLAPDGAPAGTDGVAPTFAVSAASLAGTFDRVARAEARVEIVAGSTEERHVTYVQRSAVFAFPDYVSVAFRDLDDGRSTLAVFSRARIGKSDLGVNKKRVDRWLARVAQQLES
jgi:uncharacterized protein (DUF1499 family)